MDKGKTPMDPQTPRETSGAPNFDLETVWREVSNLDIWRVRENASVQEFRELMYMIKTKADRVCYDLELDLNKLHHLFTTRARVEEPRGEPSGVNYIEEPWPKPVEGEPLEEGESSKEEESLEEEEPLEEKEPLGG